MLWNLIYDFFVHYIFGGVDTLGNRTDIILFSQPSSRVLSNEVLINMFGINNITLVSYYNHIATLISMIVILVLCCLLIKKIYNICAHIIG